jgi:hypothetical protein
MKTIRDGVQFPNRRPTFKFMCLILGVIVGFALSYTAMSATVAATSPVGLNLARVNDPFGRLFVEMVRLGEAETALRSCASMSNPTSRQAILTAESELIGGLRTDAKSSGLAPPLDVAEAIVGIRSSDPLPKPTVGRGIDEAATVGQLIKRSGWPEHSELTLREALTKLDGPCK